MNTHSQQVHYLILWFVILERKVYQMHQDWDNIRISEDYQKGTSDSLGNISKRYCREEIIQNKNSQYKFSIVRTCSNLQQKIQKNLKKK